MEEIASFGAWLKERRRALDLTQEELAQRVGVALGTVRKWETAERRPSKELAEQLARALRLTGEEQAWFVRAARGTLADDWLAFPAVAPAGATLSRKFLKGYEIREQIGAGAYGTVYRAYQASVRRDVAIKVIAPQYASRPDFIRRFEHEAQLVARLEHPHIVPLFDYWRDPSGAYLVMRYVRGGNLHTLLRQGPLPLEALLRLVEQLVGGLTVAHVQGIVHRDLKPSNILLDESRNAYLADFGIVNDVGAAPETSLPEGVSSSPAYSAPEQIRGEAVTPQADIYSLGMLLYELLAGAHPFAVEARAPTPEALLRRHLQEPLPSLRGPRPDLPLALDDVIRTATAKEPAARYADALSLQAALRRVVAGAHGVVPVSLPVTEPVRVEVGPPQPAALAAVPVENPYKGLRAFQEADVRDFFGREGLTQQLVARLGEAHPQQRFLAVVGPSGSGKSSVVRAGLIPALRRGALAGADRWFVTEMLPGTHPLDELEVALLRVAVEPSAGLLEQLDRDERGLSRAVKCILPMDGTIELVLVIDQFEELFTLVEDDARRQTFLQSVLAAVADPHSRLRVIVTLRADFYDRPLLYAGFGELMRERTAVVVPLTQEELRAAIMRPAASAGVDLEPELVAEIVRDVYEQPGSLPLLQYALTELFERRAGRRLTLAAYQATGGVVGALARRADDLYAGLQADDQGAARQLFLRLVTLGEGVEDTRRRVRRTELISVVGDTAGMNRVITVYGQYRLLTFDVDPATREPTVEVAHEALIRSWGRLRAWIDESRSALRVQRQVAAAAVEWVTAGRDPSFLAAGARLQPFAALAGEGLPALNEDEAAYVQASLVERERQAAVERERQARELALQRRAANRLRALAAGLALFLLVATGLSAFAFREAANRAEQQRIAEQNFARAESQRLAAEANAVLQRGESDEVAALIAVRSLRYAYSPQAATTLESALQGAPIYERKRFAFHRWNRALLAGTFAPDGKHVLTGSYLQIAQLWDTATGREVRRFRGHTGPVYAVAFAPDGKHVLTGSADSTARLWDTQTGQEVRRFVGHRDAVHRVAFAPDGKYVLTGSADSMVRLWERASAQEVRQFAGHEGAVRAVVFTPDGKHVLSGGADRTVRLWNTQTGQEVRRFVGHMSSADLSAWVPAEVSDVAYSPDSNYVVTGSQDETVRLWDARTGQEVRRFAAYGLVNAVAYATDGAYVLGAAQTGVVLWEVQIGTEGRAMAGHLKDVAAVAHAPDGKSVLTGSADMTARLWNMRAGQEVRHFTGHTGAVWAVAFAPDGTQLLTGSGDRTARLWDTATGQEVHQFVGHTGEVRAVAVAPDGTYVLTGSEDTTVRLWNMRTGQEVRQFLGHEDQVWAVAFAPDGKYVLTGSADNTARLWELATGREVRQFAGHTDTVRSVAVAPDGKHMLTGSTDKTVRLWDGRTGQELRQFLGHTGRLWAVAFSPDGKYVLTGSGDKSARLWDRESGQEVRRFAGHEDAVRAVAFTADGQSVLTGSAEAVRLWSIDYTEMVRFACTLLPRDFTNEQRRLYNIVDTTPTCPKP